MWTTLVHKDRHEILLQRRTKSVGPKTVYWPKRVNYATSLANHCKKRDDESDSGLGHRDLTRIVQIPDDLTSTRQRCATGP